MRRKALVGALLVAFTVLISTPAQTFAAEGYTYNYDYFGDVQYSPDAYRPIGVYGSVELGLDKRLNKPQGLYVNGTTIYLADSGNNRIIEIERNDKELTVKRVIDQIKGSDVNTFNNPTDVAVAENGDLYIADQNNARVVQVDKDLNYIRSYLKPDDANFDADVDFLPSKLTIDTAGRVYLVATNVNKGLIKYENDGSFSGFVGALKVSFDFADYVWKKLATKEQREQMESFVPTEYTNLYMDYEGFIYVCTVNVSIDGLKNGDSQPFRKINLMGNDILIRNGDWNIIGDVDWANAGGYNGPSQICDITTLENDIYFGLDRNRGKIFAYDDQGRMVYAFGGPGDVEGCFKQAIALEHMGHDLLVLDAADNSITIFETTEYGQRIFDAVECFQSGDYDASGAAWNDVLDMNGNLDLAYIGVGRALLGQKRYKEAMPYFSTKWDAENYSKAFKQYRKIWVEEHIGWIFLIVFLIAVVPLAYNRYKIIKWQIATSDAFKYQNDKDKGKEVK